MLLSQRRLALAHAPGALEDTRGDAPPAASSQRERAGAGDVPREGGGVRELLLGVGGRVHRQWFVGGRRAAHRGEVDVEALVCASEGCEMRSEMRRDEMQRWAVGMPSGIAVALRLSAWPMSMLR